MTNVIVGTDVGVHGLGGHVEFEGRPVDQVLDGWAVTEGQLHRRDGAAWTLVPTSGEHHVTCVVPTTFGALAGTAGAHLLQVVGDEPHVVEAFEAAPTRPGWHTPWGGPPAVRSLAASDDGTWYVNVHVGGILRHDDDGGWVPTIDLDTDVHQVVVDGTLVLAALGAGGLGVSHDRGESWSVHTDGLHATYCRAVALADGAVLLSASEGPSGSGAAVYRLPTDVQAPFGQPFQRCEVGLPDRFHGNIDTHCLAAAGDVAAVGTRSGQVYRSDDAGETWHLLAEGLPPIRCVHLSAR